MINPNFSSGQLDHHLNEPEGKGTILVCQTLPSRGPYESVSQAHTVDRSAFKQFSHGNRPGCFLAFLIIPTGCGSLGHSSQKVVFGASMPK
jgi:hypothetical protein